MKSASIEMLNDSPAFFRRFFIICHDNTTIYCGERFSLAEAEEARIPYTSYFFPRYSAPIDCAASSMTTASQSSAISIIPLQGFPNMCIAIIAFVFLLALDCKSSMLMLFLYANVISLFINIHKVYLKSYIYKQPCHGLACVCRYNDFISLF